ncbi:outer membrane autotransporter protein [Bartonella fuyuanensis]|uniref:Outer membrane autotransporter protein n=1 Tax=Bartonella fuyuanensis TaxID=1460968 RepID=A0A840E422_9HYPH|nr:autotransporter outer membrane beta-barrel domain-containing protein [Bartonella fuyuanensis]MBB4076878.1 outer membrane autotransporter protein [Bartonella fuyuanensis]
MHRNLLLCTAACALFFSPFNFTSTSATSNLSPQTRYALEEITKLPERYLYAIDLINKPTQAEKNLEEIASGAMFQKIDETVSRSLDDISSESSRYKPLDPSLKAAMHAQALENNRHLNMQHMMQANVYLDHLRQNRLIKTEDLLRGYKKAVSDAAQAAAILDADNQRHLNAQRDQWMRQDNRNWDELQNKENMLHKAAQVDSPFQEQNEELSDILSKAGLDIWNNDKITNVKRKEETSPLPSEENKPSLVVSNTEQEHSHDKLPPSNFISQHNDNSPTRENHEIKQPKINEISQSDLDPKTNTAPSSLKKNLNASTKVHGNSLSTVDNTATTDIQSSSKLFDDTAITTSASLDETEKRITLTPQVESSLVTPIAMFAAGFADINNQNILLDNMQITMFEPKDHKEQSIFLSNYGNKSTFSSNVQANVHADLYYAALQVGAALIALKNRNISTDFGLFGTYGKLSFSPRNKESSYKNKLDKWSLTAYGNIQHDNGIYASAFLSYGIFKENTTADNIKYPLKVNDSKTFGAAATVGQKLLTSLNGVILEPQAQLVYQHLMPGSFADDDNSTINIGNPHQWLLRIGGRLTQNKGHAISFYGKLNMIETFSKNFQLAANGSLIEGGFGIHAHLSQNIELHNDVSYQHKFKKVGISGINISGGMRYRF